MYCSKCKHSDTELCEYCIHGVDDREDHYEPKTEEDILREKIKARENFLEQKADLVSYSINLYLPPVFLDAYRRIVKCTSQEQKYIRFATVRAGESYLFATNSFIACRVHVPIPLALQNKDIVYIENGKVGVSEKVKWPETIDDVFCYTKLAKTPFILRNSRTVFLDGKMLHCGVFTAEEGFEIYFNQEYFDLVCDVIGEIKQIGYTERHCAIVLGSEDGIATIMPILNVE